MRRGGWLLTILLLAPVAEAGKLNFESACPSVKELKRHIFICGDSAYAAQKARECADLVISSWKTSAASLAPRLKRDAGESQNNSFVNGRVDYEKTVAELDRQIELMRKYTALIADYTLPMMDIPGSTGAATSLDCFNRGFDAVQKVVSGLDEEIVRAMDLRDEARGLLKTANARHEKIGELEVAQAGIGSRALGARNGKSSLDDSKVTGRFDGIHLTATPAPPMAREAGWPRAADAAGAGEARRPAASREIGDSLVTRREPGEGFAGDSGVGSGSAGRQLSSVTNDEGGGVQERGVGGKAGDSSAGSGGFERERMPSTDFRLAKGGENPLKDFLGDSVAHMAHRQGAGSVVGSAAGEGEKGSLASAGTASGQSFGQSSSGVAVMQSALSSPIANSEESLFTIVSRRYRSTELFREARPKK